METYSSNCDVRGSQVIKVDYCHIWWPVRQIRFQQIQTCNRMQQAWRANAVWPVHCVQWRGGGAPRKLPARARCAQQSCCERRRRQTAMGRPWFGTNAMVNSKSKGYGHDIENPTKPHDGENGGQAKRGRYTDKTEKETRI